jgi:outer membrane protein assembly factor BamB
VADKIIANAGWYHVAAFDKSTGALLWRTFIANDAESRKLHYHGGYVYHTQGWRLFVIDPKDGRIVFSLKPQGKDLVTIAVGNGRVFVCGYPTLQCYEAYKP